MRIMLIAGEPVVRAGIATALAATGDLKLVAEQSDARSGFGAIDSEKPDLIVMDVALAGMNGITATREVKRRSPGTHVLLLSTFTCERDAIEGFAAGAGGFAVKSEPIDTLLEAFRTVGRGGSYLTPGLRGLKLGDAERDCGKPLAAARDVLASLSPREREVLDLVVKGWRNRDIARELCVSMKTIDTHRTRINRKLGCAGTADLVRFAAMNGLLQRSHAGDETMAMGQTRTIVLLVDDDPGLRDELLRQMAAQGSPPMHATSMKAAMDAIALTQQASLFVIDANGRAPSVRAAALLPRSNPRDPFVATLGDDVATVHPGG
jgi:two-component system, NarL family, response regulator NreC